MSKNFSPFVKIKKTVHTIESCNSSEQNHEIKQINSYKSMSTFRKLYSVESLCIWILSIKLFSSLFEFLQFSPAGEQ